MAQSSTQIVRRRVNIDFASAGPGRWHWGMKDIETFLNIVSFVFPAGERFFIESVQNYMDRIKDPALKEQARLFIYQEAMHSKEHNRFNAVLKQTHRYGVRIERLSESTLSFGRRFCPKIVQLAYTCALEHFTAMLADVLLKNQERFIRDSRPEFATLWMWHAVEETEHKAVCFDVYQHVFGKGPLSYLLRVSVMFYASLATLIGMAAGAVLVRKQRKNRGNAAKNSAPSLWSLLLASNQSYYWDYYRPSFHPWTYDNAPLIEEWKGRYHDLGVSPDAPPSGVAA